MRSRAESAIRGSVISNADGPMGEATVGPDNTLFGCRASRPLVEHTNGNESTAARSTRSQHLAGHLGSSARFADVFDQKTIRAKITSTLASFAKHLAFTCPLGFPLSMDDGDRFPVARDIIFIQVDRDIVFVDKGIGHAVEQGGLGLDAADQQQESSKSKRFMSVVL